MANSGGGQFTEDSHFEDKYGPPPGGEPTLHAVDSLRGRISKSVRHFFLQLSLSLCHISTCVFLSVCVCVYREETADGAEVWEVRTRP